MSEYTEESTMSNCHHHYDHDRRGYGNDRSESLSLQNSMDTNAILTQLADVKASVPLAEAQVQLALAGSAASLTAQLNDASVANLQGQCSIEGKLAAQSQFISTSVAGVQAAADRNLHMLSTAVTNEGEKTRALITSNEIANLNRMASERESRIIALEAAAGRNSDRHGIEINMIQNQSAVQMQAQAQIDLIGRLSDKLCYVENAQKATQQAITIGGTGNGPVRQDAANTNVRA